ncbi:MAG: hypothetical protein KAI29_16080, partial [Cyclobacteriaceae bacterium]|nr:hypothetical protein [Cyclobacteriaceae bacterium]
KWNPSLALPLTHGSFTIAEFADELSGENFSTTATDEGLVVFKYSHDKAYSKTAEELVNIDDQNYTSTLKPEALILPDLPITGSITQTELHDFNVSTPEGDKLYSAIMKGGTVDISLTGNFPASGELLFTFNAVTINGLPLETTFQWSYDGTNSQQFTRSLSLEGAEVDFSNNGSTFNYFDFTTTLTLNYEGQSVTISDGLDLILDVKSMQFSQAIATVSKRTITSVTNEFTLNFIDELKLGYYYFDEPSISFNFTNSFGIPLDVYFKETTAHSDTRGDLLLTGDVIGASYSIGYPSINEIGSSVQTVLSINHLNSNLPDILAWQPNTITYFFEGVLNPNANDEIHFALDTSRISADIQLELPMIGRFRNLTFAERYDFDGSIFGDVESALFRLTTQNGFPINADVQLYFLSDTGVVIDSLMYDDRKILEAGLTDVNGKVTEPTLKEIDIIIQNERLIPISTATGLLMRATLNTPENDTRSVRIYENDRLNLKLLAQTEFEIIL